MLINHNFLFLTDLGDLLWWDHNVTSFSSTANNTYYGKSICKTSAKAFVILEEFVFDLLGSFLALTEEFLFFFLAFGKDIIQFLFLVVEVIATFLHQSVGLFDLVFLLSDTVFAFLDLLFA